MTQNLFPKKLKPTGEDYLRSVGYAGVGAWAIMFALFPPIAFTSTLEISTRIAWLAVCLIGAGISIVGSMTRRDLKVELPGIFVMLVGPFFYFFSQLYISVVPGIVVDPTQRYALVFYALLPTLLLLPRIYGLFKEIRRQQHVNKKVKGD